MLKYCPLLTFLSKDIYKARNIRTSHVKTSNRTDYLHYELSLFSIFDVLKKHLPITNAKISSWKAILPAVLIILSVENLFFMLLRRNVTLPLFLTITVLPTHPTVKIHLFYKKFIRKTKHWEYNKHRTVPNTF